MDLIDVIKKVISYNDNISSISLKEFPNRGLLQDRFTLDNDELTTMSRALHLRSQLHFPFWDCLISTYIEGQPYSKRLLVDALHHNAFIDTIDILQQDFDQLEDIFLALINRRLAISSEVTLESGTTMHIPMIDFHIPMTEPFSDILTDIVRLLGQEEGFFLASGESYHFYGLKLMTRDELLNFLARALRFTPIIDRAWISHQLEERRCALRIGYKNGVLPRMVRQLF